MWNQRINAAARLNGTTYSRLIGGLIKAGVLVDRKNLGGPSNQRRNGIHSALQTRFGVVCFRASYIDGVDVDSEGASMNESNSQFEQRKRDHIRIALDPRSQAEGQNGLDSIELVHEALPDMNFKEVDISTSLFFLERRFLFLLRFLFPR